MRWQGGRRSTNVEDMRGRGRGAIKLGGASLIIGLLAVLLTRDPRILLEMLQDTATSPMPGESTTPAPPDPAQQQLVDFVSVVLADTEDVWSDLFRQRDESYQPPRLVLFSDAVQSACGMAGAATGPFYCSMDNKVYVDLSFYADLQQRFKAPGDFAQAYVIAHEVGHHVQNLLGLLSNRASNEQSVKQELQADCFAGVWGHHANRARNILEEGDVEEALTAAAAIGDDRLQRQTQGRVTPETFTHGTSEQRVAWFKKGLASGSIEACDTFH